QAADVAGLVRALGERDAVVVGHGWGGHVAWTLAAAHPALVRRLAVVGAPHPLRWSTALRDPQQQRAAGPLLRFQLPWHPERWLVANDADNVGRMVQGSMNRDRDLAGRPRNARPRDPLGRPLPRSAAGHPPVDEPALPPAAALSHAQKLLDAGEAFAAHETLEAVWKASSGAERAL